MLPEPFIVTPSKLKGVPFNVKLKSARSTPKTFSLNARLTEETLEFLGVVTDPIVPVGDPASTLTVNPKDGTLTLPNKSVAIVVTV